MEILLILLKHPTFEVVSLCFHGQKQYKIRVSAHCSVRIEFFFKVKVKNDVDFGFKMYFLGQNRLNIYLGNVHKLCHFLCSKSSIFLTTYPPLNANVICEGSLIQIFAKKTLTEITANQKDV